MNHYCTYFDSNFLLQGLSMWRSLQRYDATAILWVLALDDRLAHLLISLSDPSVRVTTLVEVEQDDVDLAATKSTRTRVEYYFTLSPCWPRWLLVKNPALDQITYIDADMFFFSSPQPMFDEIKETRASVLVTAHRFPQFLRHYDKHGQFNVGILVFSNTLAGRECLDKWRSECLEWCYDRLEENRYADQKYLERWPARLGSRLTVSRHPGLNLAPWNWLSHRIRTGRLENGQRYVDVDGHPLILFHFARFRPVGGRWLWQSGQLDYGVMGGTLRNAIYGPYLRALCAAQTEIRSIEPLRPGPKKPLRVNRGTLHEAAMRLLFGSDWIVIGGRFYSGRFGLGKFSGRFLALLRRSFLRAKRAADPTSYSQQRWRSK